ncbi:MAG TPA: hypothetical protein VFA75_06400 [Nevskia sp.]|nr:hypothetical protein [Nevskia sp.]
MLYDKILADVPSFISFARDKYPGFSKELNNVYPGSAFKIAVIYISKYDVDQEAIDNCPDFQFLFGSTARYFEALTKTIGKSARFEFFKFLRISYEQYAEASLHASKSAIKYDGFLLPESNSDYPSGFKVVSFYADPETLIKCCYVLRRDGWRDGAHLYQRVIIPKKIRSMRRYLTEQGRVYLNNIIVTLPNGTNLNDISKGKNLLSTDLDRAKPISVEIPGGFERIGIVDGQHRVFCYHEGADAAEPKIAPLRKRQHLLVTGLVYPETWTEQSRHSFEAKLFLEINDNQTRARSALKQDIEVIINPYSATAIAKRIAHELNVSGPYKGMLQAGFFDSPSKIKTTSIVSYGLRPLVKVVGSGRGANDVVGYRGRCGPRDSGRDRRRHGANGLLRRVSGLLRRSRGGAVGVSGQPIKGGADQRGGNRPIGKHFELTTHNLPRGYATFRCGAVPCRVSNRHARRRPSVLPARPRFAFELIRTPQSSATEKAIRVTCNRQPANARAPAYLAGAARLQHGRYNPYPRPILRCKAR